MQRETQPLTPAQQDLVERSLPLVGWIVKRRSMSRAVRELGRSDAFSWGCLGLIRAAQLYDPDRGIAFSTYAVTWIWAAIQGAGPHARLIRHPHKCYRKLRGARQREGMIKVVNQSGPEDLDLIYQVSTRSDEDLVDSRLDSQTYLSVLSDRSREIMTSHAEGESPRKISQQMGCSYQNVDRLIKQAIERIRSSFHLTTEG